MAHISLSPLVKEALPDRAVVALESTVIAHGLPYPQNVQTALGMEATIRQAGAIPATIGIIEGQIRVGLTREEIEFLATHHEVRKASRRDLPIAVAMRLHAATTVATTVWIAHRAGIRVMATGGIGGMHRDAPFDVSADLPELAATPMLVVCSGAKAILDLPATREWLETHGVPVIGYGTRELPAFYHRASGLPVDAMVENSEDAAAIFRAQRELGLPGASLLVVPVPEDVELPRDEMEGAIATALEEAKEAGIHGKETTPFLLRRVGELTHALSLSANISLLLNNARVAAEVALALAE